MELGDRVEIVAGDHAGARGDVLALSDAQAWIDIGTGAGQRTRTLVNVGLDELKLRPRCAVCGEWEADEGEHAVYADTCPDCGAAGQTHGTLCTRCGADLCSDADVEIYRETPVAGTVLARLRTPAAKAWAADAAAEAAYVDGMLSFTTDESAHWLGVMEAAGLAIDD